MKLPVRLFFEQVFPVDLDILKLNRWIKEVLQKKNVSLKSLNIIFCTDAFLLDLNKTFLRHNTLTDIITFHYHDKGNPIEGELYISIERVKDNAQAWKTSFGEELDRVIIHGVLHLLGMEDLTSDQKEEMHRQEDYCLSLRS